MSYSRLLSVTMTEAPLLKDNNVVTPESSDCTSRLMAEVQARMRDLNESLANKKQQKSDYENDVDQCTRDG